MLNQVVSPEGSPDGHTAYVRCNCRESSPAQPCLSALEELRLQTTPTRDGIRSLHAHRDCAYSSLARTTLRQLKARWPRCPSRLVCDGLFDNAAHTHRELSFLPRERPLVSGA